MCEMHTHVFVNLAIYILYTYEINVLFCYNISLLTDLRCSQKSKDVCWFEWFASICSTTDTIQTLEHCTIMTAKFRSSIARFSLLMPRSFDHFLMKITKWWFQLWPHTRTHRHGLISVPCLYWTSSIKTSLCISKCTVCNGFRWSWTCLKWFTTHWNNRLLVAMCIWENTPKSAATSTIKLLL